MSASDDVVRSVRSVGRVCLAICAVGVVAALLGAYEVGAVALVLGFTGYVVTQYLGSKYA